NGTHHRATARGSDAARRVEGRRGPSWSPVRGTMRLCVSPSAPERRLTHNNLGRRAMGVLPPKWAVCFGSRVPLEVRSNYRLQRSARSRVLRYTPVRLRAPAEPGVRRPARWSPETTYAQ